MPDETVETRPPWLDFSLPRRPCLGISVLCSIILQSLNSCAIRLPDSTACPHHLLPPLTLRLNVLVLTCDSFGTALTTFMWEALSLYVGSSQPTTLPTHIIALRSFASVFFSIRDMATWLRPSTSATCFCVLSCIYLSIISLRSLSSSESNACCIAI